MTNVLLIRHLPEVLTLEEKTELLKHFGAERVWSPLRHNAVFASFPSAEQAKNSLLRLHKLEIGSRRLIVEYAYDHQLPPGKLNQAETASTANKHLKQFLKKLNAWNDSVGFYQPPSPHLKYKYPEPDETILINILQALCTHRPFYVQVLHLMNKMCLDPPFSKMQNVDAKIMQIFSNISKELIKPSQPCEDSESELSSPEETRELDVQLNRPIKRKKIILHTKKRAAAVLASAALPKVRKIQVEQQDVFEKSKINDPKKICVSIPKTLSSDKSTNNVESVKEIELRKDEASLSETDPLSEFLSKKDLLDNKLSFENMKSLSIFKNYQPGVPSNRLYIKNLAKTTTEKDLIKIYKRYVVESKSNEAEFSLRLMQEGRMKGQAFVNFPSEDLAVTALNESNGFILNNKPMVVQFAKVAKSN